MENLRKYRKGIAGVLVLSVLCIMTWQKAGRNYEEKVGYRDTFAEMNNAETSNVEINNTEANNTETNNKKTAYLTFDDGPSPNTEEIIKILENEGACATFFLIGDQITENEVPVLKKLLEKGNEVGIHTYSHNEHIYDSKMAFLKDFRLARKAIYDNLGIEPTIYRFPWGSTSKYVKPIKKEITARLALCGYQYEDWNVSAEDSVGRPGADTITANIRRDFAKYDDPVILMHDSATNKETVRALPGIIKMLRDEGYSFDVLSRRPEPFQY